MLGRWLCERGQHRWRMYATLLGEWDNWEQEQQRGVITAPVYRLCKCERCRQFAVFSTRPIPVDTTA